MVLQRPPRRWLEVAAGHRRLRRGAGGRRDVRRSGRATTSPSSAATPPRRSTTSRTGSASSPTRSSSPRSSSTTPTSCPGRGSPSAATSSATPHGTFSVDDVTEVLDAVPAATAAGDHRRLERHRVGAAHRRHHRRRPRPRDPRARRRRPARSPSSAPGHRRLRGVERAQDVRPLRCRASSSAPGDLRERRPVPGRWRRRRPGRPRRGGVDRPARPRGGGFAQRARRRRPPRRHRRALRDRLGRGAVPRRRHGRPPARGTRRHRGGPRPRTPVGSGGLPVATFVVDGQSHALVAARLSAEHAIGVRHGCFCAHPYLLRLLDLDPRRSSEYRDAVRRGDRRRIPGAVRASAGLSTTADDVDRFLDGARPHRRRRRAAGALRPGPAHRRLLAPHRRSRLVERGTATRRLLRPRLRPTLRGVRVLRRWAQGSSSRSRCRASWASAARGPANAVTQGPMVPSGGCVRPYLPDRLRRMVEVTQDRGGDRRVAETAHPAPRLVSLPALTEDSTVEDAIAHLAALPQQAAVVMDGGRPVGVVTLRAVRGRPADCPERAGPSR